MESKLIEKRGKNLRCLKERMFEHEFRYYGLKSENAFEGKLPTLWAEKKQHSYKEE